jgi:hypothetical protein
MNYDIDTRDWQGDYNYAQNTYTTILSQHSPASSSWIAIGHDIQQQTVTSFTQYMIDQARKLGYQLVTVGECLGDPAPNWYRDGNTGQPYDPAKGFPANVVANPAPVTSSSSGPSSKVSSPTPTSLVNPNFGAGTSINTTAITHTAIPAATTTVPAAPSASNSAIKMIPTSWVTACLLMLGLLI